MRERDGEKEGWLEVVSWENDEEENGWLKRLWVRGGGGGGGCEEGWLEMVVMGEWGRRKRWFIGGESVMGDGCGSVGSGFVEWR
ncbi:Hypothetical predicted protein [Prunus dulcis]|uniref:Uncharacterized protein n=1 Tax=Prunus dulcis TaxID=3755 RepID=A0A5E4EQ72_PRUDU|nr:hypothetical protein L3X38_019606 [Prunus dulcis]VVA17622.1 Hypothetical predicted protein [Prunus dulcis]